MEIKLRRLNQTEIYQSLDLVWQVFIEYEAVSYPEDGKNAFYQAIHSDDYIAVLDAYGAFCDDKQVGILATRCNGSHVALFFVDGNYHRRGIGRKLWNYMLTYNKCEVITVHSSLYAVDVYKRLGFHQTADVQEDGGIKYVPMEYLAL